jgi:Metallo-beta-lactamase superfamily
MRTVRAAAEAMGGVDRVEAVKTLVIEGEGSAPNLGQNVTPDGDLPVWKVTEFKRSIDFSHGSMAGVSMNNARMREQQVRTAQFLFALATTQRQNQGLDGAVAYNIGQNGNPLRASDTAAQDRRRQLLHHPLALVRAALEPDAKLTDPRQEGSMDLLDITLAQGGTFTLALDGSTHLPAKVTSMSYDPNLGDVAIETAFSAYQETGGLKLPMRVTTRIDKYPQFDLQISKYTIDADVGDLAAPDAVKSAAPPVPAPQVVTAQEVAKGIWWLAGSGNHRSIVFEFADHLTLFEVPVNEARSLAVIEKARSLSPKPLTEVIVSHHHFDHSGGLRAAVSQGLTIITYRENVAFFQDLVARKHTIVQDALAKNPQPLKIVPVDDQMTLKDSSMEVRLYHVKDNPREGTLLMAYVPRDRILVQADLYDSGWLQHPWADNFAWNLRERGLQVDKDVPVHGEIQTYAEVLKTIQATKSRQE